MELIELLKPELIRLRVDVEDKWELLRYLAGLLAITGEVKNEEELYQALLTREKTMSTGIGRQIAIPHATTNSVEKIILTAITLRKPIDYESFDFEPVKVVFCVASPEEKHKNYMKILSDIAKLFSKHALTADELWNANTPEEFINLIVKAEEKVS